MHTDEDGEVGVLPIDMPLDIRNRVGKAEDDGEHEDDANPQRNRSRDVNLGKT